MHKKLILAAILGVVTLPPTLAMAMDSSTASGITAMIAPLIPDSVGSAVGSLFTLAGAAAHLAAFFAPPGATGTFWNVVNKFGGNYRNATNADSGRGW
ncbi:MAG: hypothetical protein HQL97_04445 [Magnetococcales bacterium]|nr:hypothetical protein [Magnetococcales bacterium]